MDGVVSPHEVSAYVRSRGTVGLPRLWWEDVRRREVLTGDVTVIDDSGVARIDVDADRIVEFSADGQFVAQRVVRIQSIININIALENGGIESPSWSLTECTTAYYGTMLVPSDSQCR